jgi:flagellar hook-length control protein FliK
MDANAALTNLTAALAAPANAAPAPAANPAPRRSFAATLAREQPPAHEAPRPASRPPAPTAGDTPGDGDESAPASPGQGSATSTADAASGPKPTAGAKRPSRAKAGGGDDSPPDGKTLPVWLATPTPNTAPAPAVAVAAPGGATTPAAADAAAAATTSAGTAAAAASTPSMATPGTEERPDAGRAPHEAAQPTFAAAAAALAQSDDANDAGDADAAPATKPAPAPASAAAAQAPARGEAGLALARLETAAGSAAPTPAPAPAAVPADAPRIAATVVRPGSEAGPNAPRAPRPSGVRAGDAAPEAAATRARAEDTPPVAPELRRAVTAMQASDVKVDVADVAAKAPSATDLASVTTVVPTLDRSSTAAAPATVQVAAPVGSPDWAHELGERVSVLVDQNLTHAQIKLSPADLGPIEVRIAVSDGQANVSFTTHSHVTSEALQAAAPRLREALGAQGYASVNVDVAQQQFRERTPQQSRYEPEPGMVAAPAAAGVRANRPRDASAALRLDAYA